MLLENENTNSIIFLSKDNKNLLFNDWCILMEENFSYILNIENYEDLMKFQLYLFPPEVVIINYDPKMSSDNKLYHLVDNTKYCLLIMERPEFFTVFNDKIRDKSAILNLACTKQYMTWFVNYALEVFHAKYGKTLLFKEPEMDMIINLINSNKISPLVFVRTLFFLENLSKTLSYFNECNKIQEKTRLRVYQTPFMNFYRDMMYAYRKREIMNTKEVLTEIIIFNVLNYQ